MAVQIQRYLDNQNAKRDRKISIYKTLMLTRATTLDYQHVNAINLIPLEFDKKVKQEEDIIDSWQLYFDHLNSDAKSENWVEKRRDLLIELLLKIGIYLGYKKNKTQLKNEIYLPIGHSNLEDENFEFRKLAIRLLNGQSALKLDINSMPIDLEFQRRQEALQDKWFQFFDQKIT